MNVDISEIQVRGGGRGDDDLEEGEEPLREEHQWLLCCSNLWPHFELVRKGLLRAAREFFEAFWEFGGPDLELEEQFVEQIWEFRGPVWELGGPED